MGSAAQRTFSTPELLEAILIELPPLDLVKLRRTNKTFKAILERSSEIRQKLFYKARVSKEYCPVLINPLLQPALQHHGFRGTIDIYDVDDEGYLCLFEKRRIDAMLLRRNCQVLAHGRIDLDLHCFDPQFFKPTKPNVSYKDMLITKSSVEIVAHF